MTTVRTSQARSSPGLSYVPVELQFGTSGRRGRVIDLTQLEIYSNALAEIEYLQSLDRAEGGIVARRRVLFRERPATQFAWDCGGHRRRHPRCRHAAREPRASSRPPRSPIYALGRGKASIMVTGSHIPFDRNGYKLNTSQGELLKQHEAPINQRVRPGARALVQPEL